MEKYVQYRKIYSVSNVMHGNNPEIRSPCSSAPEQLKHFFTTKVMKLY